MFSIFSNLNFSKIAVLRIPIAHLSAVKGGAGTAVGKKRFRMPVETDPQKLMKTCAGANYMKEGGEIALKEDSEYPEWLWQLSTKPKNLHEYDPETKEYWERAEVVGRQREWKLRNITKQNQMIVSKRMIDNLELKYRRRFRALAKYHYNAGSEVIEHTQREDGWNLHKKDRYRLEADPRPFYPGMDKVELPHSVSKMLIFRKDQKKYGHFGL